jgi:Kef-type K+ transport system membrane component KefB
LQTKEAKLILGAAVIDDILGLIVLAVVIGIVTTGTFQVGQLVKISASSAIFLGIVVFVGSRFMPSLIAFFGRMEQRNLSLLFSLVLAFFVAWAANMIGLATIVGAFAAGLILNEEHLASQPEPQPSPLKILEPLESLFAPIFFVLMGMQVNLASFLQPGTLAIAGALIVAAIVGKVVSGFVAGKGVDKVSVGIGMVPRGEVGLIFASIGKGLGVITGALFSAVVIMVIMTTLITPLALKWSLFRGPRKSEAA